VWNIQEIQHRDTWLGTQESAFGEDFHAPAGGLFLSGKYGNAVLFVDGERSHFDLPFRPRSGGHQMNHAEKQGDFEEKGFGRRAGDGCRRVAGNDT
jgi:hypothetical protein